MNVSQKLDSLRVQALDLILTPLSSTNTKVSSLQPDCSDVIINLNEEGLVSLILRLNPPAFIALCSNSWVE